MTFTPSRACHMWLNEVRQRNPRIHGSIFGDQLVSIQSTQIINPIWHFGSMQWIPTLVNFIVHLVWRMCGHSCICIFVFTCLPLSSSLFDDSVATWQWNSRLRLSWAENKSKEISAHINPHSPTPQFPILKPKFSWCFYPPFSFQPFMIDS